MKKKILMILCAICFILPCAFMLTGCGEQFIIEGEYKIINAQVIRDNSYLYQPDSDGDFVTHIVGGMTLDKCTVNVGSETSSMVFSDEDSGLVATFSFERYNDKFQYPAFKCESVEILINGQSIEGISSENKEEFNTTYSNLLTEVLYVSNIFLTNQTSLQLVTFNQTFVCHLIIKDVENNLLLMAIVYGY